MKEVVVSSGPTFTLWNIFSGWVHIKRWGKDTQYFDAPLSLSKGNWCYHLVFKLRRYENVLGTRQCVLAFPRNQRRKSFSTLAWSYGSVWRVPSMNPWKLVHFWDPQQNVERPWSNMKWRYVSAPLYSLSTTSRGYAKRTVLFLEWFGKWWSLICVCFWILRGSEKQFIRDETSMHENRTVPSSPDLLSLTPERCGARRHHCMKLMRSNIDK